MAIGSVTELIDYREETIKLAKKYGGGSGAMDISIIADAYDPTKTSSTAYPKGDYVTYNTKLWKANDAIKTKAGAFDPEMWDAINNYDPEETYNFGDTVVYLGDVYNCISGDPVTGEWDGTKWYQLTVYSYDVTSSNYYVGSKVEYAGAFYTANSDYHNAPLGDFNVLLWTQTTVEGVIADSIPKQTTGSLYGLTTDEDGMISNTDLLTKVPALSGKKILNVYSFPYSGMAPYGKAGYLLTRINPNYWLLEAYVSGERVAVTSQELDGAYAFTFIYV